MHRSRRLIAASVSVSMALATSVAVAHADDSSSVLYVNGAVSANCTDTGSGAGSAATPFCTIQAAADAAVAGDTVEIAAGTYASAVNITSSGTASAPIVFQATGGSVLFGTQPNQAPALSFTGASYITVEGMTGTGVAGSEHFVIPGVSVNASSHITLDSVDANSTGAAVQVTGASSDITVSRSMLQGTNTGILVGPGGSDDVFSTNQIIGGPNGGIAVSGATGTTITSNTIWGAATKVGTIGIGEDSTGTSIENNILDATGAEVLSSSGIMIDTTSTAGTAEDYNVVDEPWGPAYSWAGVAYLSQAAFTAATGQGKHDSLASPQLNPIPYTDVANAPQINSADSAAPGMLDTDFYGYPCTRDALMAVTGAGSPAYCARGAVQQTYTTTLTATAGTAGVLWGGIESQASQTSLAGNTPITIKAAPTPAVSFVVDWGDGSTSAPLPGSANQPDTVEGHQYAKPGTYTITDTATLPDGSTEVATKSITTAGSDFTPDGPARILDTRKGTGAPEAKVSAGGSITVKVAGVGSIPADATAVALNLTVADATGNGYLSVGNTSVSNVNYVAGQSVANSVIAALTNGSITIYNTANTGSADIVADLSGYFRQSAADGYSTVPLSRVLDTRKGTGAPEAKVPANSGIPVTIAGFDSIPADVTAVAVHVTVTDTTGTGWVAAEPDGAGTPGTSSLDYGKNQIISNTVIVPVATDGKIELYNGGGDTSVSLIADVSGYFSANAPDAYLPIGPTRVLDTRKIAGATIPSGATGDVSLWDALFGPYPWIPANGTLAANTTVTNTKGTGYLTVYPSNTDRPITSNVNFNAGQTVSDFGILSSAEAEAYNSSTGSVDVVFDVFGFFGTAA